MKRRYKNATQTIHNKHGGRLVAFLFRFANLRGVGLLLISARKVLGCDLCGFIVDRD